MPRAGARPAILFARARKATAAVRRDGRRSVACGLRAILGRQPALAGAGEPVSLDQPTRAASAPTRTRVAVQRTHRPFASHRTIDTKIASQGVASFYSDQQETASGEKFDGHELTAAHPTLPFGTKLRVTDVKTGRSVTVRVNDRGPYVPGRIVDVSYSAAQSLGMIGKGVANVRLDVVQ